MTLRISPGREAAEHHSRRVDPKLARKRSENALRKHPKQGEQLMDHTHERASLPQGRIQT
jgi:hypothetical protein